MTMLRRLMLATSVAAVGTVMVAGPTYAGDQLASTGAPLKDPAAAHYTVPKEAAARVAAKLAAVDRLNAAAAQTKSIVGPAAPISKQKLSTGTPRITSYVLPRVANYKEGEGNPCKPRSAGCTKLGHPIYTCAANSTRTMLKMLTGIDYGEAKFVKWEGIKPGIGLPTINNIPKTLNAHFSTYGAWTTRRPTSVADYMSGIETDTLQYHQAVIEDLNTGPLKYWKGRSLAHYNVVYGWHTSDNSVDISEGWSTVFTFGSKDPKYGNPYGLRHHVLAVQAYRAVATSATGRYVL